jgi:hypothetical protein
MQIDHSLRGFVTLRAARNSLRLPILDRRLSPVKPTSEPAETCRSSVAEAGQEGAVSLFAAASPTLYLCEYLTAECANCQPGGITKFHAASTAVNAWREQDDEAETTS